MLWLYIAILVCPCMDRCRAVLHEAKLAVGGHIQCCSVHVLYMCVSAGCGMHTYTCTSCHDLISIEYVRVGVDQQKYMLGIRST